MEKKNVLAINVESTLFAKVAPLLDREEFEVDRFPRASMATELIAQVPFDVLLARFPLPDISVREFLDQVRADNSPNLATPLLLLATGEDLEAAHEYLGRGANRVVAIEESAEKLQGEISALLTVAPRSALRLMLRMKVQLGELNQLALCQTENVSSTGMLVRAGEAYPIGSILTFEFFLGQDRVPVTGMGTVVRHTTPGREELGGMGIRFDRFDKDGKERLARFLARYDA